jgi:hypothetical protein
MCSHRLPVSPANLKLGRAPDNVVRVMHRPDGDNSSGGRRALPAAALAVLGERLIQDEA